MKAVTELFTRKDYERLPEGFPVELVEGFLVKDPSPTYGHQDWVLLLVDALRLVIPRNRVRVGPVDVPIDEYNVYVPDVAAYDAPPPRGEGGTRLPEVVFEVLSPSTARRDRDVKARRYLGAGVHEVWLVDSSARTIAVRRPDGETIAAGAEAARSTAITGFALVPDDFFSPPD